MRIGVLLAALLGLAIAAWLITSVGVHAILSALLSVGWGGFALLCVCGIGLFAVLGGAWFVLVPRHENPGFLDFAWGRAVRECAGELLPFSQLGGIVIGARALTLRGVSSPLAFASSIVDVTAEMVAQIIFIMAGIVLVLTLTPHAQASVTLAKGIIIGVIAGATAAALFFLVQQRGILTLANWSSRYFPITGEWLDRIHHSLADIRTAPLGLAISLAIHLCGWLGSAIWAWIALQLIGHPVPFALVFTIEAILCGIRSAAILVPGAIGVQEASYAVIGPLFGLAAPAAIALSLLKRARDIAIGIPVLLLWQFAEGSRALKRGADSVHPFGRNSSQ
jgi:putative membrane protein